MKVTSMLNGKEISITESEKWEIDSAGNFFIFGENGTVAVLPAHTWTSNDSV